MTTFIAVRHGNSEYNKERRFSGQLDVPLTEKGRAQAAKACAYILENYRFDAIYSSDLSRAVETVMALSDKTGLPITRLRALREVYLGSWQGRLIDEVYAAEPALHERYKAEPDTFAFPQGESMPQLDTRAMTTVELLAAHHDGETLVLGSHGGFIRALVAGALGKSRKDVGDVGNCSVTVFTYDNGKFDFRLIGYNGYLTDTDILL